MNYDGIMIMLVGVEICAFILVIAFFGITKIEERAKLKLQKNVNNAIRMGLHETAIILDKGKKLPPYVEDLLFYSEGIALLGNVIEKGFDKVANVIIKIVSWIMTKLMTKR